MLSIFRKYQRYIYLIVTVVIIISFSFFGTYSTLGSNTWREQLAFQAVNGDEVTRSELDDMVNFLATDNKDKIAYGGAWGPNFLNDGVIKKDFLQTGLAEELLIAYSSEIEGEWLKRAEKEKKFALYTNPQAPFIGVEQAWQYFAPEMSTNFHALQNAQNPTEPNAIANRIHLYLAQEQIPPAMLKKILRYQEQQFNWLKPDYSLDSQDLSLFGYHTLNDWFSSHFTVMVSQFIINAAILAKDKGYEVSRAEAMADLARNTQLSYAENLKNPNLGVASPQEYFSEQLRLLNMDQGAAIKVWQQVLLFRRYFQDAGQSALMDTLAFSKFNDYANENVKAEVYHLPAALRLDNNADLQKFQVYLQAVTENSALDSLDLPTEFLSVDEVKKNYPELVQKNYLLQLSEVNLKALQSKISIKDLWKWETEDKNWEILRTKFPELGAVKSETVEKRFETLDEIPANTRTRVDAFAKQTIIRSHPEWIDQALASIPSKVVSLGISTESNKTPLNGLDTAEKKESFINLLDNATLNQAPDVDSPLYSFSADNQHYYRITVLKRSDFEILTFDEAKQDQRLDQITNRLLESYYVENREKNPEIYQLANQEWKPFKSVRDLVANDYFIPLWEKIDIIKQELGTKNALYLSMGKDQLVALRFYPHLKAIQEKIAEDPEASFEYIQENNKDVKTDENTTEKLSAQWKLEKEVVTVNRKNSHSLIDANEALELAPAMWSQIKPNFSGDLIVYKIADQGSDASVDKEVTQQTLAAHALLSNAAQRSLMQQVLEKLKSKKAISLAYLKNSSDSEEAENEINNI